MAELREESFHLDIALSAAREVWRDNGVSEELIPQLEAAFVMGVSWLMAEVQIARKAAGAVRNAAADKSKVN